MPPYKKLKTEEKDPEDLNIVSKISEDSDSDGGQDWRDDCFGVRDINSYALRKNILTDVTFFVGDKKDIFHAHRLILALGSPVFEAMFYGPLAERGDAVTIPDVDPLGFHYLLKFLYSERAIFKDDIDAIKTAFAADKYCISYLKDLCERFLCKAEITSANVWIFLQNSIYLNLYKLRTKCFNYLKTDVESALQHSSFLDMNAKTVEAVLSRSLRVPEKKLLESVIRWAHYNGSAEDGNSFKNTIMPLLPYISFRSLEAKEFAHFLEVGKLKEVLTADDALAILKHILLPDLCVLPDWCAKTKRAPVLHKIDLPRQIGCTVRCLFSSSSSCDVQTRRSSSSSSESSATYVSSPYSSSTTDSSDE